MLFLCWFCVLQALVLLLTANGAPIVMNNLFGKRWAGAIDCGLALYDQRRLFGKTKTWRGLIAAVFCCGGMAVPMGIDALTGAVFGALTMGGDLFASFLKRRCGHVESSRARGLDTVPESLLPVWFLSDRLHLTPSEIILIVGLFFLIEEFLSPILYRWHIRKRPY
jgi:hypothetical protein